MFFERRNRWSLFSTVSLTAMAVGVQALANPANPVIVAGDVAISGLGTSQVVVDNGSMRSIVNWEEFSVGSGESTLINQVSNDAAILNRVTGGNMSEIYGSLTSNGRVYLINENGIVIGASGQVGTAGFVASTLDADDAQFLGGGDMVFSQGVSAGGGIEVHGKIRSVSGGDIFLLSREIEIGESAELSAEGTVGLGAGEEILLRPTDSGEGRISIRAGKGKIVNKGRIEAAAAELRAAGGNEYALAINNTGVVRATGVSKSGGKVVLTGGGKVRNTGKLVATKKVVVRSTRRIENAGEIRAADAAGKGGQIVMESPDIVLEAGSLLDVSAALGGGSMFIGGGYQGSGSSKAGEAVDIAANAQSVSVAAGAVLDASATQSGDAGEIVVWSDGTTSFAGSAIADGGKGFIEISGREHIVYQGSVSAKGGMVLFDPGTVEIIADTDNDGIPDIADFNVTLGADADTDGIDDAFD
ncbi:MAG TPA: filamentous hemagglutinin N-terminal domain-containing protein, partial [Rhizobiaceae bacterium]|nr:filamentous hemagglutinin N-terminal domain-containing protein [Rhizobiaceae bacterium]